MLFTYDSEKVLRGFSFSLGYNWIPLLNLQEIYPDDNTTYWVIGVQDEELYGAELKHGYTEPLVYPKPAMKIHKFKIPLLNNTINQGESDKEIESKLFEEKILRDLIFINHDTWRKNKYSIQKEVRTYQQPEHYYSESIKDEGDLNEKKKEHDKFVLSTMKDCVVNGYSEKVVDLFNCLLLAKSKALCTSLLQTMSQTKLIEIINKKIVIDQFKETDSLTVKVKDDVFSEQANLIENIKKTETKNNLSDFALNLVYKFR